MRILFVVISFIITNTLNAQNLKSHQWENRVILIISTSKKSETYQKQIEQFNNSPKALRERKLVIYEVLPNTYKFTDYKDTYEGNSWQTSSVLFKKFKTKGDDFKVVLIGLDGSVKLQQNNVLTRRKLFETIDSMPMRKSELNTKGD